MYLSIPSETFTETLRTLGLAITRNAPASMPILSHAHFRVSADGRSLDVTVTDLDVSLTRTIPLDEPGGAGEACIHFPTLSKLKPDRKTPVRIDHVLGEYDAQVQYVSGKLSASATVAALAAADFPMATSPALSAERHSHRLPAKTLRAITAAIPFQSADQTRYVLNGVCLVKRDPDTSSPGAVVATDGRMLGLWHTRTLPETVILPSKACTILSRLPQENADTALVREGGKGKPVAVSIRLAGWQLYSKLIEGNYPNYLQVIPEAGQCQVTFADPAAVAKWLGALPPGSVRVTPRLPHYVDFASGGSTTTAVAHIQGKPVAIALAPERLAKTLLAVPGTIALIDELSPCLVRTPHALAVLMPMRVTDSATSPAKAAA
jgi:DNA polymerase III sliding clamp (beta) subunit (PCNA family)